MTRDDLDTNAVVKYGTLAALGAVIALLSWNVRTTANHDTQLALYADRLAALQADSDKDEAQDARLTKLETTSSNFWRLHSWSRGRINELRTQHSFTLLDWPELE